MSHQPERKEKNCLNCGAEVAGRFCQQCGQENIVTHQSFWSLTKHFVYDVLHFDGKFFHTVAYIFTRPGFVALEYAAGRRMRYLDPIRMYLFTSAIFFLIFFSISKVDLTKGGSSRLSNEDRRELVAQYQERIRKKPADSARLAARIPYLLDTTKPVDLDSLGWWDESTFIGNRTYASVEEYDSLQTTLPPAKKDGWFERQLMRRSIKAEKAAWQRGKAATILLNTFLHQLPYLLFVSLPFFALILKLLYIRRKNFFYSDHAVFTLYHYIFSFILLLAMVGVNALHNLTDWKIFTYILFFMILSWPVYLYIELKNFYRQGAFKTVGKFLLLNLAGLLVLILLFALFLLLSVFQL